MRSISLLRLIWFVFTLIDLLRETTPLLFCFVFQVVEGTGGMAVYDFDGDDAVDFGGDLDDDSKAKLAAVKANQAPKRSQTVTQAHMCNYCNYTTPKRQDFR